MEQFKCEECELVLDSDEVCWLNGVPLCEGCIDEEEYHGDFKEHSTLWQE